MRRPTALKLLDGTINVTRQNKDEPERTFAIPDPPKHLSKEQRAAWKLFAEKISTMRITTEEDFAALEMLACRWAHYQELQAKLRTKDGMTYETTTANGSRMIRPRPELTMLQTVEHALLGLLGRFGLTPADRQRVKTIKGTKGGKGGKHGEVSAPEEEFT